MTTGPEFAKMVEEARNIGAARSDRELSDILGISKSTMVVLKRAERVQPFYALAIEALINRRKTELRSMLEDDPKL